MALSNNGEGGSNGVTPTTSDTGSGDAFSVITGPGTSGILRYSNAHPAHGGLGYQLAVRTTSEQSYLGWTNATTAAQWFGRFYLFVDDISTGTTLAQFRQSAAGGILGYIMLNATRVLSIRNQDQSTPAGGVGTATLALSTTYRIEWQATAGGATGTIDYWLYAGDSTTVTEHLGPITVTQSTSFAVWQTVRYGPATIAATNSPSATGSLYLDDLTAFNTSQPGPAGSTSQFARPSSDVTVAGWTPSTGATLWGTIDETPADDTDYITSPST